MHTRSAFPLTSSQAAFRPLSDTGRPDQPRWETILLLMATTLAALIAVHTGELERPGYAAIAQADSSAHAVRGGQSGRA
ncbi:MAG TPA: hypothetical protein VGO34_14765 [Alphaproteobacteria bacterium]